MPIIIPAILENTLQEIENKIHRVEPHVSMIQIDVCDGIFVPTRTVTDPKLFFQLSPIRECEIHLMAKNPEQIIESWLNIPYVNRVIVHAETIESWEKILKAAEDTQKDVGLALTMETPVSSVQSLLPDVSVLLLLGVEPGSQGQIIDRGVIKKIHEARRICDQEFRGSFQIAVDGGVNRENAPMLVDAGADILNVGAFLFSHDDIKQALRLLQDKL